MLSIKEINLLEAQNEGLKKQNADLQRENVELKAENERLKENIEDLSKDLQVQNKILGKFDTTLQEIKGIVTALSMNNWLQMNETARKSIQLLQEKITKAGEE